MKDKKSEASTTLDTVALKLTQHGRVLYSFPLLADKVHELMVSNKLDIDRWSPGNPEGYQRVPIESKYKKYGMYVLAKGVTPTAVLISLRDKSCLHVEEVDEKEHIVRLKINLDKATLYVPDGQHRLFGLNWAVEKSTGELDYTLPAVLFIANGDDPKFEEAEQFNTIQSSAKRVRTDLAQRYILSKREKELGRIDDATILRESKLKDLEPYAVKIADSLNEDGPLAGKIAPANSEMLTASIAQSSFVDSVKPFLAVAAKLHWDLRKTRATLEAWWNAVKYKCPEAFEHWAGDSCKESGREHFNAVLVTTTGMYSLHEVLARSLLLPAVSAAPTNPETFKKLLNKRSIEQFFEDGKEGYWSSESTEESSASSHGTSRKSFKEIADDIWEALVEE